MTVKSSPERRGDSTRMALIHAGLELFGELGFNGTSTRALSDRAGANISAIPYYFGSKQGLYLAVMEYIVERLQEYFGDLRQDMYGFMEKESLEPAEVEQALEKLVQTIARLFVESEEPKAWVQLIMREQARPTQAFDIIYNGQMKRIQHLFSRLIAASIGLAPEDPEVKLRCHALIGQILIFIISRESLLRHLDVEKLQPLHIRIIYDILLAHTRACLQVPPVTQGENSP